MQDFALCKALSLGTAVLDYKGIKGLRHEQSLLNAGKNNQLFAKTLRVMRLTAFILLASCLQVAARTEGQTVTLSLKDAPIKTVFIEISKQSGFNFFYKDSWLKNAKPVTINVKDMPVKQALNECLSGQPLSYNIDNNTIVIFQKQKDNDNANVPLLLDIKGRVTDKDGNPLADANVKVKGTNSVTTTDADGYFELKGIAQKNDILIITYTGYQKEEVRVADGVLNVVMAPVLSALNDVVVVGYGKQKAVTVTGAVSSIGTRELLQSPTANVSNMLVARLTGLLAQQQGGQPGLDQSTLRIRGIGTFGSGGADPLVLIDGIVNPNFNNIDANEIESVTILKDASATAVYGVRGANGVLIITTKRGKEGKPKLSCTFNEAVTKYIAFRQNANSYDFANAYNQALQYDSYITGAPYVPKYSDADIEKYKTGSDPIFYPSTNWVDLMLRKATTQAQYNLNISGGSKRIKYFVS